MKRVLFVCVENSNRSQMAEAFARLHGGAEVDAHSAGSRPSGSDQSQGAALHGRAWATTSPRTAPSRSPRSTASQFDAVITMGCGDNCPWVPAKRREDWALPDPRHFDDDGYRAVRDEISARVRALLRALG
jgi:arsenate reductase